MLGKGIDGTDIRCGFLGRTLSVESDSLGEVPLSFSIDDCRGSKAFRPFKIIESRTFRVRKN